MDCRKPVWTFAPSLSAYSMYINNIINLYILFNTVRLFLFVPESESVLRIESVQFLACSKFFGFARVMRTRPARARAQERMFWIFILTPSSRVFYQITDLNHHSSPCLMSTPDSWLVQSYAQSDSFDTGSGFYLDPEPKRERGGVWGLVTMFSLVIWEWRNWKRQKSFNRF